MVSRRQKLIVAAIFTGLTVWFSAPALHLRSFAPAHSANRGTATLPALQGEKAVRQLKAEGLYDSLQRAVEATRYEMRWDEKPALGYLPPSYNATNPAQQFSAYFTSRGVYLSSHPDMRHASEEPEWRAEMKLIGYGYGESTQPVGPAELIAQNNRIEYRRKGLPLTEWYINKAEGLEQGYTIATRPSGKPEGERLRLVLELSGDLRAELAEEGQAIALKQAADKVALRYIGLHAYDAQGQVLASEMKVNDGRVMLEVEDRGAVYPVTVDPLFTQQAKLIAGDGTTNDKFGTSVAISGDTAVVGAPRTVFLFASRDQGAAYVFVRSGASWSLQQKLSAGDLLWWGNFGGSVAISGDTIVIGASRDDSLSNNRGSAYVFVRSGTLWSQQQKLTASDGAGGDSFGDSVAIDGETIVVGAPWDDVGSNTDQGSAYVFLRSGSIWSEQQKLTASDGAAGELFGSSVAISGNTAVVGAPDSNTYVPPLICAWYDCTVYNTDQGGSAYVFVRSGTTWSQQQKLTASDAATGDYFGTSVAVSGNTAVVGSRDDDIGSNANQGSAYVFMRSSTTWSQQQKLTASNGAYHDLFGTSVAINGDTVVVGAWDEANLHQGSAYIFARSGTTWSQQQELAASDGSAGDLFGYSVAISGNRVVVGASWDDIGSNTAQGSAYIFAIWSQQQKLTASDGAASDYFGRSVAISGNIAVVGAFYDNVGLNADQGSAYVFGRSGNTWGMRQKLTASDGAAGDWFGRSVAISGETIVVGAWRDDIGKNVDQGSAYVFARSSDFFDRDSWSQQAKLIANEGAGCDYFGYSVGISVDTVVVGTNGNLGSAHVFVRSGSSWSQQARLIASNGACAFGDSVSINGDIVVVGAPCDSVGSNLNQGSAYLFLRDGIHWSQKQRLTASDGAANDNFGRSVAIGGETIVVGADADDISSNANQGSAYVFVRTGPTWWSQQQKLTASDGTADDRFGYSVAISGDTVVVGAWGDSLYQGSVYVFGRSGTTWSQQQKLVANDGASDDSFGVSVAISQNVILVGAEADDIGANLYQGSVYVFVR